MRARPRSVTSIANFTPQPDGEARAPGEARHAIERCHPRDAGDAIDPPLMAGASHDLFAATKAPVCP
ncbi:MAG: hypothetical protein KC620_21540 [Myxococcales bacterium]|nr:hypothetical protein [Myxococcales bacterium]